MKAYTIGAIILFLIAIVMSVMAYQGGGMSHMVWDTSEGPAPDGVESREMGL